MLVVAPKSTWSHCGSVNWLDQRVPVLPSTARLAVVPPFSTEDAVAVLFSATFVVPQPEALVGLGIAVLVGGPKGVLVGVFVLVGVLVAPPEVVKTWNSQIE